MKNLLFVSSEPPFKLFTGGDTQAEIILNFLKKKFKVTIVFWKHNNNKNKIKIIKKRILEFDNIIIKKKKTNKYIKILKYFLQFNPLNCNPFDCEIDDKTLNLIKRKFDYCFLYDPAAVFALRKVFFLKKIIYHINPTVVLRLNQSEKNAYNFISKLKGVFWKLYFDKIDKFYYKIIERTDYVITSMELEFKKIKKFKKKIMYLPMPHEDDFYSKKKKNNNKNQILIAHTGHLKNSLTKISLKWIGEMVVPLIIKFKLTKSILFLILGKYKPDKEIKKLFINVNAIFLGHVSKEKYKKILYNCDALIFAAKYRIYGFINRIVSAISIPTSIVTTNELRKDFKFLKNNIHVLSSNNPKKFLENIIKLKNDNTFSKKLRNNARNVYNEQFHPKIFEDKLDKFFISNKIY
jgi:hypothetical protein